MEMQIKLPNGAFLKIEGDTQMELFTEWASAHEVFGEKCCGKCQSTDIIPVVRKNSDDQEFPELHCQKCFARLSYGQNQKGGGLYPVRKLIQDLGPDGKPRPNSEHGKPNREKGVWDKEGKGWSHYRGQDKRTQDDDGNAKNNKGGKR